MRAGKGPPARKSTGMPGTKISVYLPLDLANAAREAGVNFSGLLREAVERELAGGDVSTRVRRVAGGVEVTVRIPDESL